MTLASDLRSLETRGVAQINLETLNSLEGTLRPFSFVTSLTVLNFQYCESLRGGLPDIASLFLLEELCLCGCVQLAGSVLPLEACEKLKLLDVRFCKKLRDLRALQMGGKVPGICHAGGVRA